MPDTPASSYTHLKEFILRAPDRQVEGLVKVVGEQVLGRVREMGPRKVYLSTSGLGVYWLHMRLDQRPKYYTFKPYINM